MLQQLHIPRGKAHRFLLGIEQFYLRSALSILQADGLASAIGPVRIVFDDS